MTEIMKHIIQECQINQITQRELAEKSGLTEASVSRYFNDERTPNLKNAERMAKSVGLTLVLVNVGVD